MKTKIIAQDSLTEAAALDEAKQKKVASDSKVESPSSPEPQAVTLPVDQLQALASTKVGEATAEIRSEL